MHLSILKNNRAKAVRFTTLTLICEALQARPAEPFTLAPGRQGPKRSLADRRQSFSVAVGFRLGDSGDSP